MTLDRTAIERDLADLPEQRAVALMLAEHGIDPQFVAVSSDALTRAGYLCIAPGRDYARSEIDWIRQPWPDATIWPAIEPLERVRLASAYHRAFAR